MAVRRVPGLGFRVECKVSIVGFRVWGLGMVSASQYLGPCGCVWPLEVRKIPAPQMHVGSSPFIVIGVGPFLLGV